MEKPIYPPHVFVEFSVNDIREELAKYGDYEVEDYPKFHAMDDETLDEHLAWCLRKGYVIYNYDGSLDLSELENLTRE